MKSAGSAQSAHAAAPWDPLALTPWRAATSAALGLLAAWVAAGSLGVLAHALRHGLAWTLLVMAVVVAWPARVGRANVLWLVTFLAAAAAAVPMMASSLPAINVLAVALVLAALAASPGGQRPSAANVLGYAAVAVAVLAVYRMAYLSIPLVWMAADTLAGAMGNVAGGVASGFRWARLGGEPARPLWIGATMGGVDYLAPMLFLAAALPLARSRTRERTWFAGAALAALLVVLAVHCLYLLLVAFANDLVNILIPEPAAHGEPPTSLWARYLPWNLPAVAALMHTLLAWGLFYRFGNGNRHTSCITSTSAPQHPGASPRFQTASHPSLVPEPEGPGARSRETPSHETGSERRSSPLWLRVAVPYLAGAAAALLPLATVYSWSKPDLAGKKIVFFEKGFLNWLKPEHGQYGRLSVGMYGMARTYLESLGARVVISPGLSAEDLENADAVVAIYPNEPWEPGQRERVWDYVREGGSLMVLGEHTTQEEDGDNRFNELLEPTAMRVPFDSGDFVIGGWLHSYDALAHPTAAGLTDEQNQFGVVIGASVAARWPAQPLLIGRFGWTDFGDPQGSAMGNRRYDPGEKFGDVVLAAEQRLGRGKVICFGDTSMLTNGLTITCHDYTSRLYAHLAGGGDSPQVPWRQGAGLVLGLLLIALLAFQPRPATVAAMALPLAVSLWDCTAQTHRNWEVLPDGRFTMDGAGSPVEATENYLAYIDAGHLGLDSPESWREDGIGGLHLTLMRNGYLPLLLKELTPERLERARMLIIVAPAREYSARERLAVKEFVESGGVVIHTVGYPESGPSRRLLAELGFQVGVPKPLASGVSDSYRATSMVLGPAGGEDSADYTGCVLVVNERSEKRQSRWITAHDAKRATVTVDPPWSPPLEGPQEYAVYSPTASGGPADPESEPRPLGHFKSPFFDGKDYQAFVRFHAGWPVYCDDLKAMILAYHPPATPVILVRRLGEGRVVVIGDTSFAMNKNLEREYGSPFEGMRENADFWRWLLAALRDRPEAMWYPPKPGAAAPKTE